MTTTSAGREASPAGAPGDPPGPGAPHFEAPSRSPQPRPRTASRFMVIRRSSRRGSVAWSSRLHTPAAGPGLPAGPIARNVVPRVGEAARASPSVDLRVIPALEAEFQAVSRVVGVERRGPE